MARLAWILQGAQVAVPLLSALIGATMLGLGSHILAFTDQHKHSHVRVRDNTGWFPYQVNLDYLPPNFHITRPVLLLITGLLCFLINGAVLAMLIRSRRANAPSDSRTRPSFRPGVSVVVLDALALLFTLAITIYAWHSVHRFTGVNGKPWNGPLKSHEGANVHWDAQTSFDPINWNCVVYPFVHAMDHLSDRLHGLCREGLALVDLTVPLLILECGTLCLHYVFWRPQKTHPIAKDNPADDGATSYRMDDYPRSFEGSSNHEISTRP